MRKPIAIKNNEHKPSDKIKSERPAQAFAPPQKKEIISSITAKTSPPEQIDNSFTKTHWLRNIFLISISLLISLAIGLWFGQLIGSLFTRNIWLGYIGIAALAIALLALIIFFIREVFAIFRLKHLSDLRDRASQTLIDDNNKQGKRIIAELLSLYANRPDMAVARTNLERISPDIFDGSIMVQHSERTLMSSLDKQAKALISASAKRVAIVTAISPRALVDIIFVAYESFKLASNIAKLYGARPGIFGSLKIGSAILSHLAITGGVALGDSVVQQLLGHSMAAKVSARLGEGLINGLMSVRVGIAAMRVIRPLPFNALKQPKVMDFIAELARIAKPN